MNGNVGIAQKHICGNQANDRPQSSYPWPRTLYNNKFSYHTDSARRAPLPKTKFRGLFLLSLAVYESSSSECDAVVSESCLIV